MIRSTAFFGVIKDNALVYSTVFLKMLNSTTTTAIQLQLRFSALWYFPILHYILDAYLVLDLYFKAIVTY